MKAQSIDRLALTRKKFGAKMYGDTQSPQEQQEQQEQHREGYSICPNCGQETLIHQNGCMNCPSCGWSACS